MVPFNTLSALTGSICYGTPSPVHSLPNRIDSELTRKPGACGRTRSSLIDVLWGEQGELSLDLRILEPGRKRVWRNRSLKRSVTVFSCTVKAVNPHQLTSFRPQGDRTELHFVHFRIAPKDQSNSTRRAFQHHS